MSGLAVTQSVNPWSALSDAQWHRLCSQDAGVELPFGCQLATLEFDRR